MFFFNIWGEIMVNEDLVNYFKKGVALGNSIDALKEHLFNEGWPHELVEEASLIVRNDANLPKMPTTLAKPVVSEGQNLDTGVQKLEVRSQSSDVGVQEKVVSATQPLLNVKQGDAFLAKDKKEIKKVPTGLAIVSGFHFFIAASLVLLPILLGPVFSGFLGDMGKIMILINVAIGLVFAILPLVVGIGIWNGKRWARIVAIVFSSIFILLGALSVATQFSILNLAHLLIALYVLLYLIISREGKRFFKKE